MQRYGTKHGPLLMDSNAPVYLNAAAREEFPQSDEVVEIDALLTKPIDGRTGRLFSIFQ